MFNLLRNVPPSAAQAGDLVVTLQPEGGAIPANGSLILTTAVEGGVAPYTYEWHRENNFNEAAPLFQAKADAFAESYNSNKAGFAAAFQSVINQGRVEGTIDRHTEAVPMTSTFSFGSTMYNKGLEPVRLNLNDHSLGESESPDYPATAPGSYYCVIRDSAGHWVSTENAEVVYGLYIITQPHNVNISAGDSFSILAAGGTPPYTYQWGYSLGDNGAMNPINGATGEYYAPTAGMDGDFICLVVDANDSVVRSNVVTAYSADPLVISSITPPSTMEAGEITRLEATVMGGVPPYIGVWNGFGVDGVADGDLTKYAMMADDFGTYTFSVTDAMGQVQIGTTTVEEANGGTDEAEPQKVTEDGKPIITRQPKSMTLGYREDGNYSGILTCEAISAVSGDDSTLEYQWEGCDPTYGWLSIYKGKNMPISSAFMGFPFRCKVTDRETGENVYSDIATAQVGLSIDSITWAGNHGGGLYNEFHVYSMGGSGPYTLQVFLLTPVDYNDTVYDSYYYQHKGEYIEALFETHTFDDNANYYSLHLPRYQTVTYMKDGHYVSENILAHYRCVITDSLGKTVSEDFD